MPDISQITLPSGTTYDIKDAQARNAKSWLGITSTELTDGATTNPITINGQQITATSGNIVGVVDSDSEFIFNGTAWQEFGNLSDLGALAYEDTATGKFTPQGSVSKPSITVTPSTTNVPNVTDVGSMPTYTVTGETLVISAGTVPTLGTSIAAMTGATAELDNAPSFTGTEGTVTVAPAE